ncbi:MAG: hypothetical protein M1830_005896 [Pleopsidium flavum]|nr:MAG: hypothetical protein M1830_005896 [Pleopsidium flavum]
MMRDKSKPDLSHTLSTPALQTALINAPSTTHPSLPESQQSLHTSLQQNIALATHLLSLESQLNTQRATTQSQLLSLHALERQWRQKQAEMDSALSPFSPKSLYQRLAQAVQEQEQVCQALEESFLEGEGRAGEREVGEFLKRYREGRKLMVLRRERKERWDEGRVGGWR